jgi:hypothetical protein
MSTDTIFGGVELEVHLVAGGTEKVFVRQIPVRLMPQMLAALDDENRLVELFCDRPEGWSDNDHGGVVRKGGARRRTAQCGFFLALGSAPVDSPGKGYARHHRADRAERRVAFADWVAECAVRCGLTLAEARDHSPAQLKLLARAATRVTAQDGLLALQTTHAAIAAAWSREGRQPFDRLQKVLTDQTRHG